MTRKRSSAVQVRILGSFALFLAALAPAQQAGTSQASAKPHAASASAPANSLSFLPAVTYASGGYDLSVAVADVNGDGKPDLVIADYNTGVDVLLGNGDGTFQPAVTYAAGYSAYAVAVADVNGDGKPDIAVAIFSSSTDGVAVLLGNGDGTFQPTVTYPSGAMPDSVAIVDVNGDKRPDLVLADWSGSRVYVHLGNGDGTFQPAVSYTSGGYVANSAVVADVNGDGKTDLVVANWWQSIQHQQNGSVGVLLGNGDGTFQPPVIYSSGGYGASSVAVADVNRDGKPDLVVANCEASPGGGCHSIGGGARIGGCFAG